MILKRIFVAYVVMASIIASGCSAYIVYKFTQEPYQKDKKLFQEHREDFSQLVTVAAQAYDPDAASKCIAVAISPDMQQWIGRETFGGCYDETGEITFLSVGNPVGQYLFCYATIEKYNTRTFRIPGDYAGRFVRDLGDGWFLCNISID